MQFEPMLATAGRKVFDNPDWSFELKYAGFRALLFRDSAGTRFLGKRGANLTKFFSELEQAGNDLKGSLVLDGVIIAGDGSVASFRGLNHRYAKGRITDLKPKERVPVKYVAFDVLVVDGRTVMDEPLRRRQERLRKLIPRSAGRIVRPKAVIGRGVELFAEAESNGFEGIVAKRLDSTYESGKRSKSWLKFKTKAAKGRGV
jgi:bifunctional non-homologous end joining protein LigD